MNSRVVLVLSLVVAGVVGGVMWFLKQDPAPVPPPTPTSTEVVKAEPSAAPVLPAPVIAPAPQAAPAGEKIPPPLPAAVPMADHERKIDEILRLNPDNSEAAHVSTAQLLINLIPTLPPEGQAEAAQHVSNLLPDKEYQRVRAMVLNANAAPELLDVLVTDLMNRDDAVKLPVLLEIAKIPNHPTRSEAVTDLQIFLNGDYGTDWARWDSALKDYLKKQREESSAQPVITQ